MAMLSKKDRDFLRQHLEHSLADPVTIKLFTQEDECQYCKETKALMTEVSELSDKIALEVHDLPSDKELTETYGIRRAPATLILGSRDYGIRFYGIPSGYEFNSLIEGISAVSTGQHGLADETVERLASLQQPVHVQVFVTPTCPYCPAAVQVAHAMAIASDMITADMIESVEFPQLAEQYGVLGVPKTVINENTTFDGAAPEDLLVAKIMEAVGLMSAAEVAGLFADFEAEVSSS